ncbi:Succinate semialdehyde dehydrogenase [NAD(P)+] Sad [bacterium HR21]|nr:Succinate semialdehyde dehydrogenase [NAD(P)+] Sad [bacterium HR21]
MEFVSISPLTGKLLRRYEPHDPREVTQRLQRAEAAFPAWVALGFSGRAALMRRMAAALRERAQVYAELFAEEMGKLLPQGVAEVEKCAWVCDYYADNAERFLAAEPVATEFSRSYVAFQPLGCILAIMPWNFPFWQVFRFAAAALMAGNVVVLKHAPNVTATALALEGLFREVGFPEGVFQVLLVPVERIPELIQHPTIAAVTLTGSTRAGRAVAAQAGAALKKTVLELGGSDPYLILEDADLEPTVETCVAARLINSGQSCIAAKRFIVLEPLRTAFEEAFVEAMRRQVMGAPSDRNATLGPLARQDLRDTLHGQVRESLRRGARLLLGGEVPALRGWFYPPTVLTDVRPGMPVFDEETFGPVAAIVPARTEQEAIELANTSAYGLGAAVFTRDRERGERIAREQLQAGSCFVNAYVRSDPRLPFGGIKQSGWGRELSVFGIREFVNIKTVCVA